MEYNIYADRLDVHLKKISEDIHVKCRKIEHTSDNFHIFKDKVHFILGFPLLTELVSKNFFTSNNFSTTFTRDISGLNTTQAFSDLSH